MHLRAQHGTEDEVKEIMAKIIGQLKFKASDASPALSSFAGVLFVVDCFFLIDCYFFFLFVVAMNTDIISQFYFF